MALMEINWKPDTRSLRQFGWLCLGVCILLAGFALWRNRILMVPVSEYTAKTFAMWAAIIGIVLALVGTVAPAAMKPVYVGLTLIGLPIGFVVSHILMFVLFFLIITPIGLLMRILGKDPMQLKLQPQAVSYWQKREQTKDMKRYFRQY